MRNAGCSSKSTVFAKPIRCWVSGGCRLGLVFPEVTRMQCRAIFEAACQIQGEKMKTELEIMVPLVSLSENCTSSAK